MNTKHIKTIHKTIKRKRQFQNRTRAISFKHSTTHYNKRLAITKYVYFQMFHVSELKIQHRKHNKTILHLPLSYQQRKPTYKLHSNRRSLISSTTNEQGCSFHSNSPPTKPHSVPGQLDRSILVIKQRLWLTGIWNMDYTSATITKFNF